MQIPGAPSYFSLLFEVRLKFAASGIANLVQLDNRVITQSTR